MCHEASCFLLVTTILTYQTGHRTSSRSWQPSFLLGPECAVRQLILQTFHSTVACDTVDFEVVSAILEMLLESCDRIGADETIDLDTQLLLKRLDNLRTLRILFGLPASTSSRNIILNVRILTGDDSISRSVERRLKGVRCSAAPPGISHGVRALGRILRLFVGPLRTKDTSDPVIPLATIDTVTGALGTGIRWGGVTLNGLKPSPTQVRFDDTNMICGAIGIPVEENNVSSLRILDADLGHTIASDISVVAEATDGVDFVSHVKAHGDKTHTPPNRLGRTSQPRLVHLLGKPTACLTAGFGVVGSVVADAVRCMTEHFINLAQDRAPSKTCRSESSCGSGPAGR
nr:MAG TPA: hypothetical protein [Caudoviricetes sp.]